MSKQLDMLILFAFEIIATRGIQEYKDFVKRQHKLNSVTMASLESNKNK